MKPKARYLEYGGKLLLVCIVCMLGVAGAYVLARSRIEEGKRAALLTSLKEVLQLPPDAADPQILPATADLSPEEQVYVSESDEHGRLYAAQGGKQGYSSVVKVAVGAKVAADGALEIVDVRVISQAETPGLGTRVAAQETNLNFWTWIGNVFGAGVEEQTDYSFLKQYRGKKYAGGELGGIVAMTGVTISSNATTGGVEAALRRIAGALEGER
jgi:electron transport complex protein RnfG